MGFSQSLDQGEVILGQGSLNQLPTHQPTHPGCSPSYKGGFAWLSLSLSLSDSPQKYGHWQRRKENKEIHYEGCSAPLPPKKIYTPHHNGCTCMVRIIAQESRKGKVNIGQVGQTAAINTYLDGFGLS